MGIISFGIAFEAGRNRVPYPAIVMMPFTVSLLSD
jgi:hypothetical protein